MNGKRDSQTTGSPAAPHGRVFWVTGLSGAGKTTTARGIHARLRQAGRSVVLLDGDELRDVYGDGLAYSRADRLTMALRNARLCRLLAGQGIDVVCATISLFHECHAWSRRWITGYHEIHLRVPLAELRRRDRRGVYNGTGDEPPQVMGLDLAAEEPLAPDLVVENDGRLTAEEVLERVWQFVRSVG